MCFEIGPTYPDHQTPCWLKKGYTNHSTEIQNQLEVTLAIVQAQKCLHQGQASLVY